MATLQKASVVLADAEPVARFGLVKLVNSHADLRVCAEAETVVLAREACAKCKPDVLVIDPQMCGGEGFTLLKELPRWSKGTRAVVFTSRADAGSVQRAFQCGVCAYVTRLDSVLEVMRAISGALNNERHFGSSVEHLLIDSLSAGTIEMRGKIEAKLTEREMQIFRGIGGGRGARAMASDLKVSVKTIETHTQRIKAKLGLIDCAALRREAVLFTESELGQKATGRKTENFPRVLKV